MVEHNALNNENSQPYNNKEQSEYQHLFLSEQLTQNQNQSNIEALLPPDQLYVTPQINNSNYYQTNPQNNNLKSLNNSHFINAGLNNGTISHKRKKLQIILICLLYIMGIIGILLYIYNLFLKKIKILKKLNVNFLIILITSILNIILASIMVYYTKKKQSSRTILTSIFSCILVLISEICLIFVICNLDELNSNFQIFIAIFIAIFIFSFYFLVFLFNLKTKYFKSCDKS